MSKIGKKPIIIKSGTTVTLEGNTVKVSGSKGQFTYQIPEGLEIKIEDGKVMLALKNKANTKLSALYGLTRANLANILSGAEKDFEKKLELTGVGYKAKMQGADLTLSLGFAHPVVFKPKNGIKISVDGNFVLISGADKSLVGETAANIRAIKPPEPYKGKGIKYAGERIRRKAGKAAKAAGAK